MALLEEVFGVSSKPVKSYVEREDVDNRFRAAVEGDKQIVVYGASKQGKTALISKYLAVKSISPPILAYDPQNRLLQVVDSTFYFFIKHADTQEILAATQNPLTTA